MNVNPRITVCLSVVLLAACPAGADKLIDKLRDAPKAHPRLFFDKEAEKEIKLKIKRSPALKKVFFQVKHLADGLLDKKPQERKKTGKRLLGVSRECLERMTHLAMTYRLTGDSRYAARGQQEMLAMAQFSDWNPSHFLDVAEMTTALAIGYDWMYEGLEEKSRYAIREAIVKKGLVPSLEGGWWVKSTNNWNQVCHGGLVIGALAVLEDKPKLAEKIIRRSCENLPIAMKEYAPDGAYPEGPGYWKYGTSYNVLLLSAMESVLGTDFGLAKSEGFMESAAFYMHMIGPTRKFYNYSDCFDTDGGVTPAVYWLASKNSAPGLLFAEKQKLLRFLAKKRGGADRLFPFLLLWAGDLSKSDMPAKKHMCFGGKTPLAVFRTGWNKNDTFLGIKGGSPGTHHAHMDIGSFVVDSMGTRWAEDLGAQRYYSLESKGVDLWHRQQNQGRWTVFRLNNKSHNTLVVNDGLQLVKGHAKIVRFSDEEAFAHAIVDMGPVYPDLARAARGAALLKDGSVLVRDELKAVKKKARVRWGMVTKAKIRIKDRKTALLARVGKLMVVKIRSPGDVEWKIYLTDKPPAKYDAPNPDTCMLGFETTLDKGKSTVLEVHLVPGGKSSYSADDKTLAEW